MEIQNTVDDKENIRLSTRVGSEAQFSTYCSHNPLKDLDPVESRKT